ncbi:MAG: FkbM family methyltransferase [Planctomycetota bacterium]|jgi:FkbM family methyltransferase
MDDKRRMPWKERARFLYRAWRYRAMIDSREIAFLRRTLSKGQTAIDVGAHKGGYTYWMHRAVGRRGRVFAFEPQPDLAEYLERVKTSMKLGRLTVVSAGLSSSPGEARLIVPGRGPSPGARLEDGRVPDCERSVPVRVDSLCHYFERHVGRPIHFIKCDVEGHELEVFQGGRRILEEDRPALLFECERRHRRDGNIDRVFRYLRDLRYEGFFWDGQMRPLIEFDPDVHQNLDRRPYVNNFAFLPT